MPRMCGRYAAAADLTELVEQFGVEEVTGEPPPPRWNIAPTDPIAVITTRRNEPGRALRVVRWGLVPSWSKGPGTRAPLINARAETITTKPSFRKAFATRRCIVPMNGYYEWRAATEAGKQVRQPWFLHRRDGAPAATAGIYEWWRDESLPGDHPQAWLPSCAIITTEAADDIGHLHDRMPVLLEPQDYSDWLNTEGPEAELMLRERSAAMTGLLTAHPVSRRVNKVGEDGADLIEEIALP
ncbi:SOS response-associated peptidase [Enemella sp. A6]|uniref:SOS response-associated peptidase n=1 Tax=Enemella sp. A6 TaxID=3440152 RepID=UPI003EBBBFFB